MNDKQVEPKQTIWPWEELWIVVTAKCEVVKQPFNTHSREYSDVIIDLFLLILITSSRFLYEG